MGTSINRKPVEDDRRGVADVDFTIKWG